METLHADAHGSVPPGAGHSGTGSPERSPTRPHGTDSGEGEENGAFQNEEGPLSRTYAIACSSAFRDAVSALSRRRGASIADIVRAVLYVVDTRIVAACPDPGGPLPNDREEVVLLSGPSRNRVLKRKPRLQVRLPDGLEIETIRKSLALALAMDKGAVGLKLVDPSASATPGPSAPLTEMVQKLAQLEDENQRLRQTINSLSFPLLEGGVRNRAEALYVLGFPPFAHPESRLLKERYRLLARIHHPDGSSGDHGRMSQLNAAFAILQAG
ncbi:MAG: J domain-containing protein [Alphaproteobacteria bacterium]